ncbi:hypothetical protein FSP39_001033 [Pinctada imbricata]|uniref:nitric-oxide synthase (NADPH) n=1 Tax=Pinctada imbricata TaxID=66713 RepID=A0AA88YHB5_PINIB|nr:hypothetical protein FSP39_001033 [Pinctada imbricata]
MWNFPFLRVQEPKPQVNIILQDTCEKFQVSETEGNTEIPEADVLLSPGKFKYSVIEQTEEPSLTEYSTEEWGDFKRLPLCSVRTALTRFLDITTPPSIDFLKAMALQSGSRKDIALLENLSNDAQSYEEWKLVKDPNILEILETFSSIRVDPTLLLTQLPILQQRYYRGTGPEHHGVCSSWLNSCDIGESIHCAIREDPLFHIPDDATLPVIMVGTGTGVAPFRSFWQQRQKDRETLPSPFGNTKRWGDMDIYFGCRQSTFDNIYGADLDVCKNDRVFSEVNVALSSEPGVKKTYVQDFILKNEDRIYHQLMRKGGHSYVCGDVIMASEVESTLEQILQNKGNMSTEDVAKCLSDLKVK